MLAPNGNYYVRGTVTAACSYYDPTFILCASLWQSNYPFNYFATSVMPASPQPINTPITLSVNTDESNLQYQFWVYNPAVVPNWTQLQAYSTTATCIWTPNTPGNYYLAVTAQNLNTGQETTNTLWYTVGVSGSTAGTGIDTVMQAQGQGLEPPPVQTGTLSFQWATSQAPDNSYPAVQVKAVDLFGIVHDNDAVKVVVANTPPTLTISSLNPNPTVTPPNVVPNFSQGSLLMYTISNTVLVGYTMTNGESVLPGTAVYFYLDSELIGVAANGQINWDTTQNSDGQHLISFQLTDVFGRVITSNKIPVFIINGQVFPYEYSPLANLRLIDFNSYNSTLSSPDYDQAVSEATSFYIDEFTIPPTNTPPDNLTWFPGFGHLLVPWVGASSNNDPNNTAAATLPSGTNFR